MATACKGHGQVGGPSVGVGRLGEGHAIQKALCRPPRAPAGRWGQQRERWREQSAAGKGP